VIDMSADLKPLGSRVVLADGRVFWVF